MRISQTLFTLTLSVFLLAGCSAEKPQTNEETDTNAAKIEQTKTNKLVREMENSKDSGKDGTKAKGSCNDINESSTCIEYYGTFWTETQMKMMCEGSGTFSTNPCSNDMTGGCNTGSETMADMVAWMYLRGDGEITKESLKYAQMACGASMSSKWINVK